MRTANKPNGLKRMHVFCDLDQRQFFTLIRTHKQSTAVPTTKTHKYTDTLHPQMAGMPGHQRLPSDKAHEAKNRILISPPGWN